MRLARCNSHRAREKLERALGRRPIYYFHWSKGRNAKGFARVRGSEVKTARAVTGVTVVRDTDGFMPCWTD